MKQYTFYGLYCKTLRIRNLRKIDVFRIKLVSSIASHKHSSLYKTHWLSKESVHFEFNFKLVSSIASDKHISLYKHTSFLRNLFILKLQCFYSTGPWLPIILGFAIGCNCKPYWLLSTALLKVCMPIYHLLDTSRVVYDYLLRLAVHCVQACFTQRRTVLWCSLGVTTLSIMTLGIPM